MRPIVVTGFEPYGGRALNPAQEIMRRLAGRTIAGTNIIGRTLTVSFRELKAQVLGILHEERPAAVISLGLWPGEAIIRIERVGINVADCDVADNKGDIVRDEAITSNGREARFSTLPLRSIEAALVTEGIPASITSTAGTFLCNACLYSFLEAAEGLTPPCLCGFLHLPYLPEQVAQRLAQVRREGRKGLDERMDLPSMDLPMGLRAVEIAIAETVAQLNAVRTS